MHINVLRGWYIKSPEAFLRCFDFTAIDTVKCLFFHLKLNTTLSFRFRRRPCLSVLAFSLCALPSLSVDSTAREGSSVCGGESLVLTFPIQLIHRYCFLTRSSHSQKKKNVSLFWLLSKTEAGCEGKVGRQVLPYEFEWPCSFSIIQVRLGTIYMQDSAARWRRRWTFAGFVDCFVGSDVWLAQQPRSRSYEKIITCFFFF